jgi:hypothetical protein
MVVKHSISGSQTSSGISIVVIHSKYYYLIARNEAKTHVGSELADTFPMSGNSVVYDVGRHD